MEISLVVILPRNDVSIVTASDRGSICLILILDSSVVALLQNDRRNIISVLVLYGFCLMIAV